MGNCNACGAPLTPEGDCPGQVDGAAKGPGDPNYIPEKARADLCPYNQTPGEVSDWCRIWDESAKAQHLQDRAKFRKLVEGVRAEWEVEEGEPEYYGAIKACDDILKKLEEAN